MTVLRSMPQWILAGLLCCAPALAQYGPPEDDPPPQGDPPDDDATSGVTHDVTVQNFQFIPANLEINAGDTVRWTNNNGTHNVDADDGVFRSGTPMSAPWEYEFTFSNEHAGDNPYHCDLHGGAGGIGMSGMITVDAVGGGDDDDDFDVNFGITGSWANLATLGQGWLFEVVPGFDPPVMVAYNFTFPPAPPVKGGDPEFFGNQMWLVGAGEIEGNTVTVMADRPFGGVFDDPMPPIIDEEPYATFIFTFFDCLNGMVEYDIPSDNLSGEYPIERLTPDVLCEAGGVPAE